MKAAFSLDEGEVETVAHCEAARYFDPLTDAVLDIGGQDMKYMSIYDGTVDDVILNEACSAGCGSFLSNFAESLGYTAEEFAAEALSAKEPVDLGTRCTVFMNSNVKEAQKEGATVQDISAGLAYSVVKNALFKVIKFTSAEKLGKHIVVQGGTFYNKAVLRALELITGTEVIRPDIAGIMGAFGAALIARGHYSGQQTCMLSLDEIEKIHYSASASRCNGCSNNCLLTVTKFDDRKYISGNRCEKGLGKHAAAKDVDNLVVYKRKRIFDYEPISEEAAYRGTIGIPRVLNMYENYPFWAVFFRELGFRVVLSPFSSRDIYERGMESIPSESECYPAKLSHGHIQWLVDNGIKTIFYPSIFYEHPEHPGMQNKYNCPIVISYPENINNNMESLSEHKVRFIHPFLSFADRHAAASRLCEICRDEWKIPAGEVQKAVSLAWDEQRKAKEDIKEAGRLALQKMREEKRRGIVLAGRPYHIDPEINHGIPEMIASYGFTVFTEDSIAPEQDPQRPLRVLDQWVYHSRLYTAAEFVCRNADLDLIQLNSFGCGVDAVTTDQVMDILRSNGKLYTLLKIDEVNNLGSARIRIRSLFAAIKKKEAAALKEVSVKYIPAEYTKKMNADNYTLIAPQMSPIHFDLIEPALRTCGYNIVVLDNDNREAIESGLKYVNNDACYPSITTIGQIMQAVTSGKFDTDRMAILMSQTGGCCRASNYSGFIRRALEKCGLSHIPVISLSVQGIEKHEGFKLKPKALITAGIGLLYGDLFLKCLYKVRPYEKVKGSADRLHEKWKNICIRSLTGGHPLREYAKICRKIVKEFDELPIYEDLHKPKVGIVGEILVKYMPLANNHVVELLEAEGAEAVVLEMLGFFEYCALNGKYKQELLAVPLRKKILAELEVLGFKLFRRPACAALEKSKRFDRPADIEKMAKLAEPFLSHGNQYGEGWFLAAEMAELLESGTENILCVQPFGCLPNHVVGKGVIKRMSEVYERANIAAIDYDPGASEVNQLNRIKLMLSAHAETAQKWEGPKEEEIKRKNAKARTPGKARKHIKGAAVL